MFRFAISGSLTRLSKEESFDVTLKVLQCEVFTVSPIKVGRTHHSFCLKSTKTELDIFMWHAQVYNEAIQFAPIGLTNMYNSGGAVEAVESSDSSESKIHIRGRGEGDFGAYSNLRPKSCCVNSEDLEFKFREQDKLFVVTIPAKTTSWDITICYWGLVFHDKAQSLFWH